jgi:hypothetical protein
MSTLSSKMQTLHVYLLDPPNTLMQSHLEIQHSCVEEFTTTM